MLIERLELFMVLAREEHFGRAAIACRVTQPTLSFGIKQLEQTLGVMLVKRGSRFRGLTPEGEQVLTWARRILSDARSMREEINVARRGLSGRISIGVIPTALATVSDITVPFGEKHPGVSFSILSRTSVEILSMLGNSDLDIGITYLDHEPLGDVITVPLYRERYHLITSIGGPLHGREAVSWSDVAQVPLCLLTPDMQNRRIIDRHLTDNWPGVRPTLESNSMIALLSHVRTGKWASVMPLNLATAVDFGAAIKPVPIIAPEVSHMVGIIAARR
jgi:DNA-binding transcriptional LysR family regulator